MSFLGNRYIILFYMSDDHRLFIFRRSSLQQLIDFIWAFVFYSFSALRVEIQGIVSFRQFLGNMMCFFAIHNKISIQLHYTLYK